MKTIIAITAVLFTTIVIWLTVSVGSAQAHAVTPQTCTAVAALYPPGQRQAVRARCVRLAAKHTRDHLCQRSDLTPFQAIDCIWPAHGRADAKRIFDCESTAHVANAVARANSRGRWARNGQYWGTAQMGSSERATSGAYQIGSDARIQIRSALGLYRARGWQPWACA